MNASIIQLLERAMDLHRWQKQAIVFAMDMVLLILATWIAYSLRIGIWVYWNQAIASILLVGIPLTITVFTVTGVYQAIFRYAGSGMIATLIRSFLIYGIGMSIAFIFIGVSGVPRTMGALQPIIFFMLVASSRIMARYVLVDLFGRRQFDGNIKHILVYGAGDAGQQLVNSLRSEHDIKVIGYIDDDKRLDGQKLDGDRVYWSGYIREVIERYAVTDVLLALPRISRKKRRNIVDGLREFKVTVKTLPKLRDIVGGNVSISDIRPLDIEDLLGREPVTPNELLLGRTIVGKNVLVSGAGGSIGSELCRQIVKIGAKSLILLDISEFSLYSIEKELRDYCADNQRMNITIIPVLGSVADKLRLAEIFKSHDIDTVYHAAAYKHVPLVEANPLEAIRNNIIGTFELVNAAYDARVTDFILISTDKAVRPTNVMGATKRAAEQILQSFADISKITRFSMVRFGNVLGSSGSVVPLFRRQIEAGGPVTLTHKDITRYFMTIPEAAALVIQAGGMAKSGEVFVLDMGKPVRIEKLARTMIQLSGLTVRDPDNPDGDIEITEVGLRPGEKLYEELLIGEQPKTTKHERIMMAHEGYLDWNKLSKLLHSLDNCRIPEDAINLLQELVPEFDHRRDNLVRKRAND
ncbi:polysaccharide biosynthesis protein [Alterisphingorhabdus coralli]|uniref:Nucleoside-diphosphate sugar epimerase/dehydratase n=1 Tax=Alterisphingorhabdus coralli TaxID=3071408 RepID=A0AA97F985_9SPHN|nr:nucleoside-diphosphate sugar epimerase/dehydratase [Parasphingorhabdus sp. SCSIO 66989]WOE74815.1 nucleoside-diphosphate sugar epimerase/dehydratase [Parasphingorhabdus sp. SCSIO 66989]